MSWPHLFIFIAGWLICCCTRAQAADVAAPLDYTRQIKPLLLRHCTMCHGALKQEAGLRLDTGDLIRQGTDDGPVVVPGKSADSLLIVAVTRAENRMPAESEPLTEDEITLLRRWIDSGADAPAGEPIPPDPRKHWAFQRPERPAVPNAGAAATMTNPIDAFLAKARDERGLSASRPADKAVLLRRVYLDLIGLPPTRTELHAFLADESPEAFERVVEGLLARPQHGERWARHWMDVWRYADWAGYGKEVRDSQQHIWRWRDWIVESLNADRGYDRMIVDMLAGDELSPEDPGTLRATGYLARNWYRFNRNVWLDNTVEHMGKAFLGMTFNCARCHDHMYDPIAQRDYYRLRAFFEPYDVRIDRLAAQPNVELDGIARVYDAHHDRQTFLFVRGQESEPQKDDPLGPGVPVALGNAEFKIEPVHLPASAFNPGLRGFLRDELRTAARAAVEKAKSAAAEAATKLAAAQAHWEKCTAPIDANGAVAVTNFAAAVETQREAEKALAAAKVAAGLADKHLATTTAELASLEARIVADNARYARPTTADAPARAAEAVTAVNCATICAAEEAMLVAEAAVDALPPAETADEKQKQDRKKAEEALAAANQKLKTVRAEAEKRSDYPPLDKLYPATSTGRRLALARWIADRNNPLTARVAVNHLWMRHFGEPLVATVFNFGVSGASPVNAELLDWLAVELMDRGWSMKSLHRLIVTSQAYCMVSTAMRDDSRRTIDPDNRFLWRANPRRMEAETVRDSVLCVAGQLDMTIGGADLAYAQGLTVPRRSLYFQHANEKQMTFLKLFDLASVNECYRRSESIVPQQALALANSPLALEQSRRLAASIWQESNTRPDGADERFVGAAFEQVLSRSPSAEECSLSLEFLARQAARLADKTQLTAFAGGETAAVKPADDPAMRAREDFVHVLLNHNDFVTIR
ncbi:MAG TPA: PSD1 and planctomycete cytochrome C domain-containing protein [Pirellulales bacterium]|nr:PSD1 and planctomycete cytochrome C domain-containing protein [Pirellulales bacterium]